MSGRKVSWCHRVPRLVTAPPNSPKCTPDFTVSDRSPWAIISNPTIVPGTSAVPPYSWGNPERP
jgi:hypothetical protein